MKDLKQVICSAIILMMVVITIPAQSGGTFTITKSVIAGGGGHSDGGTFGLDGTIGQPFGGATSTGGTFSLQSGFWSPEAAPSPTPGGSIAGNVTYTIVSNPVPGVTLNASGAPNASTMTDNLGNYLLAALGPGAYTVTPSKPTQTCGIANGIFSSDASKVSQFVVGLRTFTSDQIIAAKVAGNPFVSSADASLIARRTVGLCVNPTNLSGQWVFMPSVNSYPEVLTNIMGEDYTAILMGDVDGDWNPLGPNRPIDAASDPNAAEASLPKLIARTGSVVNLPLTFSKLNGAGVGSYQFDILYDPDVIEPAEIAADLTGTAGQNLSVVYNVPLAGLLKVAVYGAFPASGDGVYANLRFTVIGAAGTSSALTIRELRVNEGMPVKMADGQVRVVAADTVSRLANAKRRAKF